MAHTPAAGNSVLDCAQNKIDASDLTHNSPPKCPLPGLYRHYKGNMYKVLGTVLDTETSKLMVLYRSVNSNDMAFVRPRDMFIETVEYNGIRVARFRRIQDAAHIK